MGVENAAPENAASIKTSNKIHSIQIYKPPAARKLQNYNQSTISATKPNSIGLPNEDKNNENSSSIDTNNKIYQSASRTRERRPDRAVYMAPRARRSSQTPANSASVNNNIQTLTNSTTATSESVVTAISSSVPITTASIGLPPFDTKLKTNSVNHKIDLISATVATQASDTTASTSPVLTFVTSDTLLPINNNMNCDSKPKNRELTIDDISSTPNIKTQLYFDEILNTNNNSVMSSMTIECAGGLNNNNKYIKDSDNNKDDEKELRRASQEINRSNRRIIKQTFNSDVLEIAASSITTQTKLTVTNANTIGNNNINNNTSLKSKTEKTAVNVNTAEDDWEAIFDDNGDCLDPKLLGEITSAVGKVTIEKPEHDYKLYHSKQAILNDEEFPHVLEVSNFPVEFETRDLMMIFSPYKATGFDIKWVDDTHALAVFSSSKIAAEVLSASHTLVCVKPLAEATNESRTKARKCAGSLQPYRQRPETCAALARRLVTSALGVKLKTAREEREVERRVLKEAKERKLLAAKQQSEIWDS